MAAISSKIVSVSRKVDSKAFGIEADLYTVQAPVADVPTRTFTQSSLLQGHDSRCAYRFSPDGKRIVHGCATKLRAERYDGKKWHTTRLPGMKASLVRLSSNGERMISFHVEENRCTMTLWNTETRLKLYHDIQAPMGDNSFFQVSPDCLKVFMSSSCTLAGVLDIAKGRLVGSDGINGRMSCAAFSSDGEKIVSVRSDDGEVIVWDTNTATISGSYKDADGCVDSVAISPDGKHIVLGFTNGGISLMEAQTGMVSGYFSGHKDVVQSLAFSPDGKWMASASSDMTVRVWNVETRDLFCPPLTGHLGAVVLVFFSPDGRRILSHGDDETIRVWTLQ